MFFLVLAGVAAAQSIRVIDLDSVPVPYVAVTTAEGRLVGTTDVYGRFDAAGNDVVCLSHVAYSPMTVTVSDLVGGVIVMEDAGYAFPAVEVKPKELLYVQTYYRLTYIDADGPIYYRAGIIDNTYETATHKINAKTRSISGARSGLIKFLLNTLVGGAVDNYCKLQEKSIYQLATSNKGRWAAVEVTTDSLGRCVMRDSISVLGYVDENRAEGTRATTFDSWLFRKHLDIAREKNAKKKAKKQAELDKKERQSERYYYEVYHIDEDGNSTVSDFMMQQMLIKSSGAVEDKNYIMVLESFAVQTAYIDKKEFKQTRRDNETEKNYEALLQYEQAHNIPPLAPHLKAQVDKLFTKK